MADDIFTHWIGRFLRLILVDLIVDVILYWTGRACLYVAKLGHTTNKSAKQVTHCITLGVMFWLSVVIIVLAWHR